MTGGPGPAAGANATARPSAAQLCAAAELSDDARALLSSDEGGSKAFVGQLLDAGLLADAVRFLAYALPRRESVWWAWVCARKTGGAEPSPPVAEALASTERWIMQPTDEHRRAAMVAAEKAEFGTPAGCAALAAFLSTGSVAPPHVQAVPAPEFASAKAVAGSVTLSAVADPKMADERFREYIGLGLEVAERTRLWAA